MNKRGILVSLWLLSSTVCATAQITITPGTTLSVVGGTNMTMSRNLTISNGGALANNGNVMMQGGNFTDSGFVTFSPASSLVYNGIAPQQFNIIAPLNVANLVVNNPNGIAPTNSITIENTLVLNNGNFYADTSFPIHFANTAANPGESNTSRIIGRAVLDPLVVGTNAVSFLGCNIAAGTDMGTVSIVRNSGDDAVVIINGDTSIAQAWAIGSSNNAAHPSRNVIFNWLSIADNNRDMTAIYPFSEDITGTFARLSDTARDVSATDPRIYSLNLTSFDRLFTFANHKSVGIPTVTEPVVKVTAFPNPFGSVLSLSVSKNDDEPVQVRVMDLTGKTVLLNTYKAGRSTVIALDGLGSLAVGSYMVQVYNDHFGKGLKVVKAN